MSDTDPTDEELLEQARQFSRDLMRREIDRLQYVPVVDLAKKEGLDGMAAIERSIEIRAEMEAEIKKKYTEDIKLHKMPPLEYAAPPDYFRTLYLEALEDLPEGRTQQELYRLIGCFRALEMGAGSTFEREVPSGMNDAPSKAMGMSDIDYAPSWATEWELRPFHDLPEADRHEFYESILSDPENWESVFERAKELIVDE